MAAPIRGMRPFDAGGNDYKFAHAAGHYFRQKPTKPHLAPVYITKGPDGERIVTARVVLRKPRVRIPVSEMTDRQWAAHLLRVWAAKTVPTKSVPTRKAGKSAGGSGPTLLMRG